MGTRKPKKIRLLQAEPLKPDSDSVDLQVDFEPGKPCSFVAETPDGPRRRIEHDHLDYSFGTPVLFVKKMNAETLKRAVKAMAGEHDGIWLDYYDTWGNRAAFSQQVADAAGVEYRESGPEIRFDP